MRWKLVADFKQRLNGLWEENRAQGSWAQARRKLHAVDYLSLFLFGLFNPVVRTMQGLCAASDLGRVREEVCGRHVSLGSFSEAQHLLDPALLENIFTGLSQEVGGRSAPNGSSPWVITDSTLWEALPRMGWALWRHQQKTQRAVRLHLCLHVLSDTPRRGTITAGNVGERQAWQEKWEPGINYIGDRNFGQDYRLLGQLEEKGCGYILRLRESATMTVEEEWPLLAEDKKAGVIRQAWVRLGCRKAYHSQRVRLVWVQTPKEVLLLVTNQQEMSAELVAQLYRQRWQVELFFRWIKCVLGCRHWLAESPEGVAIEIYLALIAALLLQLYSGARPNRRMMETLQFYAMGLASLEEVEERMKKEKARQAAKKQKT